VFCQSDDAKRERRRGCCVGLSRVIPFLLRLSPSSPPLNHTSYGPSPILSHSFPFWRVPGPLWSTLSVTTRPNLPNPCSLEIFSSTNICRLKSARFRSSCVPPLVLVGTPQKSVARAWQLVVRSLSELTQRRGASEVARRLSPRV